MYEYYMYIISTPPNLPISPTPSQIHDLSFLIIIVTHTYKYMYNLLRSSSIVYMEIYLELTTLSR